MKYLAPFAAMLCLAPIVATAHVETAQAQEISDAHRKVAMEALDASGTTKPFDDILLTIGERVKSELINARPDLADRISDIVDEKMIELAPRRGDLEREAALVYAKTFTEEELAQIRDFYGTDAGRKILSEGPIVAREIFNASRVWTNGVQRDLARAAGEAVQALGQ